jgi:hypothetical protein
MTHDMPTEQTAENGLALAQDWRKLRYLDETQLGDTIAQLQAQLQHDPAHYATLKTLGIAYAIQAERDLKTYAPKAVEVLTRAHALDAQDSVTTMYLGTTTTKLARTTRDRQTMGAYISQGMALAAQAIAEAPENLELRLVRAMNAQHLPAVCGQAAVVLEDFEYVAQMITQRSDIPPTVQKIVYTKLAELYRKSDAQQAEHFRQLAEAL